MRKSREAAPGVQGGPQVNRTAGVMAVPLVRALSSVNRVARPCLGTCQPGPISLPLPEQVATASCFPTYGFPEAGQRAGSPSYGYPQLATRLAAETGAVVLTFDFRGLGSSEGDFSLSGWRADLVAGMSTLRDVPGVEEIWLVGFAAGGTLSICAAGEDPTISGVGALARPGVFAERGGDPRRFLAHARATGLIRARGYPPDPVAWARELIAVRPTELVAKIPPRPLLIIHGASDDVAGDDRRKRTRRRGRRYC